MRSYLQDQYDQTSVKDIQAILERTIKRQQGLLSYPVLTEYHRLTRDVVDSARSAQYTNLRTNHISEMEKALCLEDLFYSLEPIVQKMVEDLRGYPLQSTDIFRFNWPIFVQPRIITQEGDHNTHITCHWESHKTKLVYSLEGRVSHATQFAAETIGGIDTVYSWEIHRMASVITQETGCETIVGQPITIYFPARKGQDERIPRPLFKNSPELDF